MSGTLFLNYNVEKPNSVFNPEYCKLHTKALSLTTLFMFVLFLAETSAILRAVGPTWPGSYEVSFMVKDQQGFACPEPQKATIRVCTCEDGVVCGKRGAGGQPKRGMELGPAGIGLLLLGLLLLLRKCDVHILQKGRVTK